MQSDSIPEPVHIPQILHWFWIPGNCNYCTFRTAFFDIEDSSYRGLREILLLAFQPDCCLSPLPLLLLLLQIHAPELADAGTLRFYKFWEYQTRRCRPLSHAPEQSLQRRRVSVSLHIDNPQFHVIRKPSSLSPPYRLYG